jgi:hypothetical protein
MKKRPKSKIEYQVVLREGEDVITYDTLLEARKVFDTDITATELRKVVWHPIKDFYGKWIPVSEEAEREDITIMDRAAGKGGIIENNRL